MVLPMARSHPHTVRIGPFVTVGGRAEMVREGELEALGARGSATAALSSCIAAPFSMKSTKAGISMPR